MTLRVVTLGAGPDLALLHGWGLGCSVWKEVAGRLATRYRVHLISLPGYDGSAADTRDFDGTATALFEALPAGSTLCGWSLGGMLALASAAQHPNHFARLILVATTPKFVQADDWAPALSPALHAAFTRSVLKAPAASVMRFIPLFNQGDTQARHISRQLTALLAGRLPSTAVLEKGLTWLHEVDLRWIARHMTLPTLVFHGDQDPLIPIAAVEWFVAVLPRARLQLCPGAAHAPFVAAPAQFCAALIAFCDETG